MARIAILDDVAQEGLELLDQAEGIEYVIRTGLKGKNEELRQVLAEADGAICRSGVTITADVLKGNRRLRAIVRAGVGVDNIDHEAARRLGIVVMNTPAGNTISTAELAFALMLAMARNIHPAYQSLIEGRWDRKKFMGSQLAGNTLGIIGLGRIGQTIARRALAFEMKVIGFDPFVSAEKVNSWGIDTCKSIQEMLPKIDFLTVHVSGGEQTKNMIGMQEVELLKPGARLVNCARGGIYNEEALVAGLKSGKIAGVGLDVYPEEPCTNSPLFGMPGVVCTPHLGASTEEAQTNVAVEAAELLVSYFQTGAIRHAVNASPIDPKEMATLRPYLNLANRLGLLHANLIGGSPPKSCEIHLRGKVADMSSKLLTAAFASGLLSHAMDYEVNIINSADLLEARGIKITSSKEKDIGTFSSLISTKLTTDEDRCYEASGTVIGNQLLRVVRLDEYRLESYLDGICLILYHYDKPGIIGTIGTLIGRDNVNIAHMSVGRATPGGQAIAVLNLDSEPSAAAIAELKQDERVIDCRVVKLPPPDVLPSWLSS